MATAALPAPPPVDERDIDLADPGGVWLVEAGHFDLFAIEPTRAGEAGRRRPLFSVSGGAALIGMTARPDACSIVAIPALGTRWRRLDAASDGQREGWARRLLHAVIGSAPDSLDRVDPAAATTLASGERVGLARKATVLSVIDGTVRIGGRIDWTAADGALLGVDPLWLDSEAGATLAFSDTGDHDPLAGLAGLHRFFLIALDDVLAREREVETARLALRATRESDAVSRSLRLLANAAGGRGVVDRVDLAGDAITAALAPVLRHLGMGPPPALPQASVEQALQAAGARGRRILFRPGWQTDSAEPVIGYLGEARLPVALLPGRGWRVVGDGIDQPLDGAIEDALQMEGLQVYRTLPLGADRFGELFALGLRGGARDMVRVLAMALAGALAALAVPLAMGAIFDGFIPNGDTGGLVAMIAILVIVALASGAFSVGNALALLRVETRFEINASPALMDRLLRLPPRFFRAHNVGDLVDRLLGIQHARALVGASLSSLLFGAIFAVASLGLLISYSLVIGIVALVLAAIVAGSNAAVARAQLRLSRLNLLEVGRLNGFVLQLITGVAKLRGAAAERRAMAQWSGRFASVVGRSAAVRRWGAIGQTLDGSLPLIAVAIMYGTIRGGGRHLSTGDVIAIAAAFAQLLAALLALARASTQVAQAAPLIERARPLLETPPEARPDAEPIGRLDGSIALRNISFRYTETGPLILDNLSLDIPAGSFAAFVGPSGSGKSTVLRLLLGFEAPTVGEVLFDGRVADRIDPVTLRRQIGVVLQNGRIFSGSILENILGPASVGISEAWAAARMVGLDSDIEAMPMGMHTVLLDGGGTISGGQRQRILIARALVHRPRILLFDEATSALDNRTQGIVTDTLTKLSITRVVIAHRLSTITEVDRVFVVDRGRLVQQGGYRELLDQPGAFAELARRQMTE